MLRFIIDLAVQGKLVAHMLPRCQLTAEDLADIIAKRHRLREDANESHARRFMAALELILQSRIKGTADWRVKTRPIHSLFP